MFLFFSYLWNKDDDDENEIIHSNITMIINASITNHSSPVEKEKEKIYFNQNNINNNNNNKKHIDE